MTLEEIEKAVEMLGLDYVTAKPGALGVMGFKVGQVLTVMKVTKNNGAFEIAHFKFKGGDQWEMGK